MPSFHWLGLGNGACRLHCRFSNFKAWIAWNNPCNFTSSQLGPVHKAYESSIINSYKHLNILEGAKSTRKNTRCFANHAKLAVISKNLQTLPGWEPTTKDTQQWHEKCRRTHRSNSMWRCLFFRTRIPKHMFFSFWKSATWVALFSATLFYPRPNGSKNINIGETTLEGESSEGHWGSQPK